MATARLILTDDNGVETYNNPLSLAPGMLDRARSGLHLYLIDGNHSVPNPNFDPEVEESDLNPRTIIYTGDDAVAYAFWKFAEEQAIREIRRRKNQEGDAEIQAVTEAMRTGIHVPPP